MSSIKQRLLTNWHFMRILRLGIGIMMAVMAIQSKDPMIGIFSVFFLYQSVTDTGCCGTQTCYMPGNEKNIKTKLIENNGDNGYDEVK